MPKRIENAKIALLNCPLEVEKTEFDAKIHIETPEQMEEFLREEEEKLAKATGARIVTNIDDLAEKDLGYADVVEERKVGEDKMVFVEGCIVDEAERSIHDALCVVRDVVEEPAILAGGGAPELELARRIRRFADSLAGKERLAALAFADALESIPVTLAENAGLDPIDVVSELTAMHEKGNLWAGVDVFSGKPADMWELSVVEPLRVKRQVIKSAVEAASMILKIDDVIAAAKIKEKGPKKPSEEEFGGTEF